MREFECIDWVVLLIVVILVRRRLENEQPVNGLAEFKFAMFFLFAYPVSVAHYHEVMDDRYLLRWFFHIHLR